MRILCSVTGLCLLVCLVGSQLSTSVIPFLTSDVSTIDTNCSSVNTTQCTACPAGTFSSNDTEPCVCCRSGFCLDSSGCFPCSAGFYQPQPSQLTCLPCPEGFYSNTNQSTMCQSCPAGYYSNQTASVLCMDCDKGFFSSQENATSCQACLPGTFCNVTTCTSCTVCPNGQEAVNAGSPECSLCLPGTSKGPGQLFCVYCRDGEYQDKWGAERCEMCPAAHYCPSPDISPIACPEDAFCPEGSTAPRYCMETFLSKSGDTCVWSTLSFALLMLAVSLGLVICAGIICYRDRRILNRIRSFFPQRPFYVGPLRAQPDSSRTPLMGEQNLPGSMYVKYDSEPVYAGW
ncbi:Hypothetical predicted protein [Pelobates cultripes]|uniref:Tyrosine-protein kinase ephrin type A/B receptor-like domain-containing protein n=1 Tax=Pelobates cultripes TaxID=61616 RepID=A0AAD1W9Z1_PELCU|nr:Hypothetical predicted protein [Pelobates cultripes]